MFWLKSGTAVGIQRIRSVCRLLICSVSKARCLCGIVSTQIELAPALECSCILMANITFFLYWAHTYILFPGSSQTQETSADQLTDTTTSSLITYSTNKTISVHLAVLIPVTCNMALRQLFRQ